MTMEVFDGKISLEYRLATPNGERLHKSYIVDVAFNAVDSLPRITRDEMESAKSQDSSVYFSEIFVNEIGKALVLRFSGRTPPPAFRDEILDAGPLVLQN
jgi:hypothetical protein